MRELYTIGHSTRSIDEFIDLLKAHSITLLVDIRTIPKSRHNDAWRCHRSLVSDALLVRGMKAYEIIGSGNVREHTLSRLWQVYCSRPTILRQKTSHTI